jgi:rhamnosyltransferase
VNAPACTAIAAVVVLYNPCADVLDNIDSYAGQVGRVIAVDNSEKPDAAVHTGLAERGVDILPMGGNRGIATALNAGCRRANDLGYTWVLTMDQDSTATPEMVASLASVIAGDDTAAIAIVAPLWQHVGLPPEEPEAKMAELDYAMTSGNLLRLAAFASLDGFRDDLFIDQVDHEYCLRARSAGWRIVQKRDAALIHRMGALREVRFPLHGFVTDYSPLRRYYMVRNFLEMQRVFGGSFPEFVRQQRAWIGRDAIKAIAFEPHRLAKVAMMYRGWSDFRRRRFGSYDSLHSS